MKQITLLFSSTLIWVAFLLQATPVNASGTPADTTFNQVNDAGQKTGWWKRQYPNGTLMYVGKFDNGKPIGTFKRYNPEGKKIAQMDHSQNFTNVTLFYDNGQKKAVGKYKNQKKDSTWVFYTEDGYKINTIEFHEDLKTGKEQKFYRNGQCSEIIPWTNNEKHGIYKQFYPDGTKKMEAAYQQGERHGRTSYYHPNGKLASSGLYSINLKSGSWIFLSEKGDTLESVEYTEGVPDNQEERLKKETQEILELEKKEGQISQPEDNRYNQMPPQDKKGKKRRQR